MIDNYLTRRFSNAALAAKIVDHYKRLPTLRILARQPFVSWMVATVFERCYRYQGYGEHPPRLTPFYVNILIVQTNRRLQFYYGKNENELVMSGSLWLFVFNSLLNWCCSFYCIFVVSLLVVKSQFLFTTFSDLKLLYLRNLLISLCVDTVLYDSVCVPLTLQKS